MEEMKRVIKPEVILAKLCEGEDVFVYSHGDKYAVFTKPDNTYWGPDAAVFVGSIKDAIEYVKGL